MLEAMAKVARFAVLALTPALLGALASACVEPAGAARIVGPDGTQMLHVHCGDDQVACFQIAGEQCPRGYFLSPIFDPHDGNFLVRCKDPGQSSAVAVATPPAEPAQTTQVSAVHARPPEDGWPPAEVARPSEPWPAPSAGAPVPKTAIGDVDLGY
jgi:hypothetical protein